MRKNVVNGKRILAFALAFSMVLGNVGTHAAVVSAKEADDEEIVETTDEMLPEEEEATVELPEYEAVSAKPGQVTNLRFDTKVNGVVNDAVLSWDAVQGAESYQILVSDGTYTYSDNPNVNYDDNDNPIWTLDEAYPAAYNLKYNLTNLIGMNTYASSAGGYPTVVKGADGKDIKVVGGKQYTISVRAVSKKIASQTSEPYAYGDWSAPITYTMPVMTASKVTNVKIDANTGILTFTKAEADAAEIMIKTTINGVEKEFTKIGSETAEDGSTKSVLEYETVTSDTYLPGNFRNLAINEPKADGTTGFDALKDEKNNTIRPFQTGVTYTVAIRGRNDSTGTTTYSDWSAPVTYTVAAIIPEATGNLKYTAGSTNRLSWNSVKNAAGYEIQLTDAAGTKYGYLSEYDSDANKSVYTLGVSEINSYTSTGNSIYISVSSNMFTARTQTTPDAYPTAVTDADGNTIKAFASGVTYTAAVRAYSYDSTWKKIYSAWSAPYTFTVATNEPPVLKVTDVVIDDNKILWKKEANAKLTSKTTYYQLEVKDTEGREYFETSPVVNADGTVNYDDAYLSDYRSAGSETCFAVHSKIKTYVEDRDAAGALVGYIPLVHETGDPVYSFEPGKTYKVRVRAYRVKDSGDREYGEWSDEASYTTRTASAEGIKGNPAAVTGLVLKTEDENGPLSAPELRWNRVDNVTKYEFEIKDSKGNLYTEAPNPLNQTYITEYPSQGAGAALPSIKLNDNRLTGKASYILTAGSAPDTVKNAKGETAKTFEGGETYTIRVRAVNEYAEWDQARQTKLSTEYYYGPWSNAVTYKAGKASAITGLKFVKYEEGSYYFTYKATVNNSTVYYQIANDANFNAASLVQDWTAYADDSALLAIDEDGLDKGKTYYIRAVNYPNGSANTIDDLSAEEIAALSPAVTTFTTIAQKAPKNITGLKIYCEYNSYYALQFATLLKKEDGDCFELQTSTDSVNWTVRGSYSSGNGSKTISLNKSDLIEGTNYVRVVGYVNVYDEVTGTTNRVYGAPSNVLTIKKDVTTSSVGKLSLKGRTESAFTFTYSGTVNKSQNVYYQISDTKTFATNREYDTQDGYVSDDANKEFSVAFTDLTPGKKYYVRVRVENNKAKSDAEKYSKYSNVVTVSAVIPKISIWSSVVTKNSVTITASDANNDQWLTGYEIQRQDGKKWIDLAKTANTSYVDKKLKADTTYYYRARAYFFNPKTGKTTTGAWAYTEATTWGAALKLTAKAASKTSVKLTWSKVAGAAGYEVYRGIGSSGMTEVKDGQSNDFSKSKLVKSLGAGAKSYTDKGLTSGCEYWYSVVAYKMIDGKKVTISESSYVSLAFELNYVKEVKKANGKVTLYWNPVYTAKGYLVEKKDNATGVWKKYKTIKKASTGSITFPKTSDTDGVTYRVRAYNGKKYTNALTCTVKPVLAAPTGVKATASKKGDAITITWKKVKGADAYLVYRTTDSRMAYNKDTKSYYPSDATQLAIYTADATQVSGYRYLTTNEDFKKYYAGGKNLKFVDKEITYTYNGVKNTFREGPKTGVTYYYYVVAVKDGKAFQYADNSQGDVRSGYSKQASATLKRKAPGQVKWGSLKAASKKVTVKFKKVNGADGYEILRSTDKKKGFEAVGTVKADAKLTFVDKNSKKNVLKKGKTYYYIVRAFVYNDAGEKVYGKATKVKSVKAK